MNNDYLVLINKENKSILLYKIDNYLSKEIEKKLKQYKRITLVVNNLIYNVGYIVYNSYMKLFKHKIVVDDFTDEMYRHILCEE